MNATIHSISFGRDCLIRTLTKVAFSMGKATFRSWRVRRDESGRRSFHAPELRDRSGRRVPALEFAPPPSGQIAHAVETACRKFAADVSAALPGGARRRAEHDRASEIRELVACGAGSRASERDVCTFFDDSLDMTKPARRTPQ